jgi:ATP-binding cassette subfamily F protein 3
MPAVEQTVDRRALVRLGSRGRRAARQRERNGGEDGEQARVGSHGRAIMPRSSLSDERLPSDPSAMTVLSIAGLYKGHGAREILAGIDLAVARGDKIGCVGRNGAGKTTLLRLVEGDEQPDRGTIQLERGARIGHVEQRPVFEPGVTVRAFVEEGLSEVRALEKELDDVAHAMAEASGDALASLTKRHGDLVARMEFLGGWEADEESRRCSRASAWRRSSGSRGAQPLGRRAQPRLSRARARERAGRAPARRAHEPSRSGGDRVARGVPAAPGERRAHRQATTAGSSTELVDSIVEIERGRLTRYPGNYAKYLELKAERYKSSVAAYESSRSSSGRGALHQDAHGQPAHGRGEGPPEAPRERRAPAASVPRRAPPVILA